MSSAHVWLRNLSPIALALCAFSCAHAPDPDPHVHLSAPAPPFDKPLIVRGNVADATTGEPIPYADVYVVDARHENWAALSDYSAHLGTANGEAAIDLAATLIAEDGDASSSGFRSEFWQLGDTQRVIEAAEAQCREGKPPRIAIVLAASLYKGTILFPETQLQFDEFRDANVLQLGTVTMVRRPDSDYTLVNAVRKMQEADAK